MSNPSAHFYAQLLSKSIYQHDYASLTDWHQDFLKTTKHLSSTLQQAALGGRYSHNMSFAFSAGYQSALHALFKPTIRTLSSLCVTEKEGNLPKHIQSCLSQEEKGWQLSGEKSFITGASEAKQLYIAVKALQKPKQAPADRPKIKMLSIASASAGIEITAMPALPFVPDISHGTASFNRVEIQASQILTGDGHSQYVKPFRTYEDIHVLAAITGFRIGEAINSNWSSQSIEAHLTLLTSLLSLNPDNFDDATTHIIFSGCRTQFNELVQQTDKEFERNNTVGFDYWKRDKALLGIASKAHEVRTQRAWDNIFSELNHAKV